jgi:nucleoside-diphosphate-sugar epimerase
MQVLVVGGTRFVGYQLVWRLLAGGQAVTILNRNHLPDPFGERVRRIRVDRTSPELDAALGDGTFDAVVDFAAYTGQDARRAVSLLRGRAGHYIFVSSGQVYLVCEGYRAPAREPDYYRPVIPEPADPHDREEWEYGVGKREAEDVLTEAWAASAFPATRLRLPMVNGERDHQRRVESYLWRILDGGPVLLPDGGANVVRHVYSGAVVDTIARILGHQGTFGEAYNLAQDRMLPLSELVMMVAGILGAPSRLVAVSEEQLAGAGLRPTDVSPFSERWMSCLDPSKARVEIGFKHEALRSYLEKIVTCFLNHPPEEPPDNYAHRERELELAASL